MHYFFNCLLSSILYPHLEFASFGGFGVMISHDIIS